MYNRIADWYVGSELFVNPKSGDYVENIKSVKH